MSGWEKALTSCSREQRRLNMRGSDARSDEALSCWAHGREVPDKLSGRGAVAAGEREREHDNGVVIGSRASFDCRLATAALSGLLLFGLVT